MAAKLVIKRKLFDNLDDEVLLTTEELAKRLNCKPNTIRAWRYLGKLPNECMVAITPRMIRYRWNKIQQFLLGDLPREYRKG